MLTIAGKIQTVAHGEPPSGPLLGDTQRLATENLEAPPLQQLDPLIRTVEQIVPPSRPGAFAVRRRSRLARRQKQLGDVRMLGNRTLRFVRPDDRQRDEDAARPGGHLVQVEVEPPRQKQHLGRHGGTLLPTVLPEDGQVDLGVGVGGLDTAEIQDHPARLGHVRRVRVIPEKLQNEVRLDGCAHLRRAAVVDRPTSIRQLQASDAARHLLHALLLRPSQELEQQDVLRLEHAVRLELAPPVPVLQLESQEVLSREMDRPIELLGRDPCPGCRLFGSGFLYRELSRRVRRPRFHLESKGPWMPARRVSSPACRWLSPFSVAVSYLSPLRPPNLIGPRATVQTGKRAQKRLGAAPLGVANLGRSK